mgnify:CR=1 FL=1
MSKTVVKLRVYKGKEILLKADAKTPANENELITLTYNDLQWKRHLVNLGKMGVCKIEVEKVYIDEKEVEISEVIKKEVEAILKPAVETLTPEQKAIRELQENNESLRSKLEAFMSGNANGVEVIKPVVVGDKEAEFKTKVDLLVANGFERVEDNFNKEDKTYSVEKVYEITLEELTKELIPAGTQSPKEPVETLEELQKKYFAKFGKEVSNRYVNNIAWIKTQLEA